MHLVDAPTTAPSKPLTSAKAWFEELDGHDVYSGTSHWLACVLGIHIDRDEAWVQLSLLGRFPCSVVLHLLPGATRRQAIAALSSWLDCAPADRPRIVEV